jgi:cysteine synthase A
LGYEPSLHQIQGLGDGFIPDILDVSMVDDVVEVSNHNAIETTRQLGTDFGLLVGINSGANVLVAHWLAEKIDDNIASVLPDRVERHFSTALL